MTPAYSYRARVLRVIDADTYDVEVDAGFRVFARMPLRLAGVDAPERGTPDGERATALIRDTLGPLPVDVVVQTYKPTDSFGRYLAKVFLPADGLELGDHLIAHGLAVPFRR